MDQRLAVEAKFPCLAARRDEACVIGEIEMYAVEDCHPTGTRRQQAKTERRQQWLALARVTCAKVLGEIRCSHDQSADTLARGSDFRSAQDAAWRFDHAPDRQVI